MSELRRRHPCRRCAEAGGAETVQPKRAPKARRRRAGRASADDDTDNAPSLSPPAAPGDPGCRSRFGGRSAPDVAQRLGEKFSSQLGGRRPSVVKALDKAVWRVRVSGLSRESAVGACEKIKAAGGQCYVP